MPELGYKSGVIYGRKQAAREFHWDAIQCHGNNAPEMEFLLVSGKIDLQDISEMHPV